MAKTFSAKINAPEILEKQISRKAEKEEHGIIALSSATEPCMHVEENINHSASESNEQRKISFFNKEKGD